MKKFASIAFAAAVSLAAGSLVGCLTEDDSQEDGADDAFSTDGKDDAGGIVDGSPEALGVLRVANELTLAKLRTDVKLSSTTAKNIDAFRNGADKIAGTGDDRRFANLAQLDHVSYVGPVALAKLLSYAQSHDFVHPSNDPFDPASCQGPAITQAEALARAGGGYGATWEVGRFEVLTRSRWCSNPSDDTTCGAWRTPQRALPVSSQTTSYYGGEIGSAGFEDLRQPGAPSQIGFLLRGETRLDPEWPGTAAVDGELECEDVMHPETCTWRSCLLNSPRSTCSYTYGLALKMESRITEAAAFAGVITNSCARLTARPSFGGGNWQIEAAVLVRF
jgi:hypothetical protein